MADRLETLFQEWYWLGGAVMVAEADPTVPVRRVEAVLAESTACCRQDGRLLNVVFSWLAENAAWLDETRLFQEVQARGDLSVLGVLCDLAGSYQDHPKLRWLRERCPRHEPLEIFYAAVARNPLATRLTREHPHAVFLRWGYLCRADEVRFLGNRPQPAVTTAAAVDLPDTVAQ